MKKEILEQIERYRTAEVQLIILIQKDPVNAEPDKKQLEELRDERKAWLVKIGGGYEGLSNEKFAELYQLVKAAESKMVYWAIESYQLIDYIEKTQVSGEPFSMREYERRVDDLAQLEYLAESSTKDKVSKIVKFGNKRNRKNFLSDIVCKFKKSKLQEKSEEKESE